MHPDTSSRQPPQVSHEPDGDALREELASFDEFGRMSTLTETTIRCFDGSALHVPTFVNEFWTSKQRAAHSLHEVSYRACFKPQLPRFFMTRLTRAGDVVYDPFMGRGTTLIEAALMGRVPYGCDVNPLSEIVVRPRLAPPRERDIAERLRELNLTGTAALPEDLLVFYHPQTLREIGALRAYYRDKQERGTLDSIDRWVRMVAVNRLTGHSPGFFSVYTLPPNQAVSIDSQRKINTRRNQTPPRRDVRRLIQRKSRSLLRDLTETDRERLATVAGKAILLTQDARTTPGIPDSSVDLVVTSPPFLDVVNYAQDNWLRCWFCGIDVATVGVSMDRTLEGWQRTMTAVFQELARVLKPGGHVAFEVGEVRSGAIKLDEAVVPCGVAAGLDPLLILINDQEFTKTSNCWGIDNRRKGTNTNRIVLLRKPRTFAPSTNR